MFTVTARAAPGRVTLSWSAQAGARKYRVRRDGATAATVAGLTWTDGAAGRHTYVVVALDRRGVRVDSSRRVTASVVQVVEWAWVGALA